MQYISIGAGIAIALIYRTQDLGHRNLYQHGSCNFLSQLFGSAGRSLTPGFTHGYLDDPRSGFEFSTGRRR